MASFDIPGNTGDWINTGVQIRAGQWLHIQASGFISFAFGGSWPRSADGVDPNGQGREIAPDSHPGPRLIRNSLLVQIGGHTLQAGTNATLQAPADGTIFLLPNDDFRGDNGGSWHVDMQSGALRQRLLVARQGALAKMREQLIDGGLERFRNLVAHHTSGQVLVETELLPLVEEVDPSELVAPATKPNDGFDQLVAGDTPAFRDLLQRHGRDADGFDGVFRLYGQPAGYTKWNYWTWPGMSGMRRPTSYTTIPVDRLDVEPDGVDGIVLHEYLHHMDFRFNDIGIPGFYSPDTKPHDPLLSNHQFYERIMRRETDGSLPPYGRLHGTFGRLG